MKEHEQKDPTMYRCDGCDFEAPVEEFEDTDNAWERISDGEVMSSKQCPKDDCGSLAYPVDSRIWEDDNTHRNALVDIFRILDGSEWSSDTAPAVADVLKGVGFVIADTDGEGTVPAALVRPPTEILIEITGGMCNDVYVKGLNPKKIEIILRDFDNIKGGDEDPLEGGEPAELGWSHVF